MHRTLGALAASVALWLAASLLVAGSSDPAASTTALALAGLAPTADQRAAGPPSRPGPPTEAAPLFLPLQVDAALEAIGADRWQAAGFTGFRQKVAIIDAGFSGYQAELGVGLPASVTARSFRSDRSISAGTSHGRLAAEVVHAVAPSAQLYLVNFGTAAELSAAVDYLIAEQVDVISFSLGFIHSGPGDGTGPINDIVQRAADAGIAWAVASGNWALQHWGGAFTDTDGDSIHEFAANEQLNGRMFLAGDLIVASLRWVDAWGAACNDYDLELFGPDGSLVAASRRIQECTGDPIESLQLLATTSGRYSVRVVEAEATAPAALSVLLLGTPDRGDSIQFPIGSGSLAQPADNPAVLTVGALSNSGEVIAPYSSRGPTTDGRGKPDLVSSTGVSNGVGQPFAGTSAAAPHVAGMLALVGEAFPEMTGPQRLAELRARAEPFTGSTTVRAATLGTLVGLGALLPVGAEEALLVGEIPSGGGIAAMQYHGPDGYPLRFAHLLTGGIEPRAIFRLDAESQLWSAYVPGAPDFVQGFTRLNDDDLMIATFPPAN